MTTLCPYCGRPATRLVSEIEDIIEDAVRCLSCRVDFVRVGKRWFEGRRIEEENGAGR